MKKKEMSEIARIQREAAAAGLSYGKYVARTSLAPAIVSIRRKRKAVGKCIICGGDIYSSPRAVVCELESCRQEMEEREKRGTAPRNCSICGRIYLPSRKNQRICFSTKCREEAVLRAKQDAYSRKKEKEAERNSKKYGNSKKVQTGDTKKLRHLRG